MKFLFLALVSFALNVQAEEINVCGFMYPASESSREAFNSEDNYAFLRLDCSARSQSAQQLEKKLNGTWIVKRESYGKILTFTRGSILKGQKGWITRARGEVVRNSGSRDAAPYICLEQAVVNQNPCESKVSSSDVKSVAHFRLVPNTIKDFLDLKN